MKLHTGRSASENARRVLPKMAEEYFAAGRKAVLHKKPPEDLHRFRIATKRFRYSLELFQPVYGPGLNRYLQSLRQIQNTLGDISDIQTIAALLAGDKPLQDDLTRKLRHPLRQLRQKWLKFDANGALGRLKAYLARIPGRPSAAPAPKA